MHANKTLQKYSISICWQVKSYCCRRYILFFIHNS